MRVVLSRKGFDGRFGGGPSPVLPDGTFLSLPIPIEHAPNVAPKYSYADIFASNGRKCLDVMNELDVKVKLKGKPKNSSSCLCHPDPDIAKYSIKNRPSWRGLFGQTKSRSAFLFNQHIGKGDLFLFFGLFRKTAKNDQKLVWIKDPNYPKGFHALFGYLYVAEVYPTNTRPPSFPWDYFPHKEWEHEENNVVFEAAKRFGKYPGCGVFKFDRRLILTKYGFTQKSFWDIPACFRGRLHNVSEKKSWEKDYLKSGGNKQEYPVDANESITKWALKKIKIGLGY